MDGCMKIESGATHLPARTDYIADGTGRDTYIRRDPVATYGKQNLRPEYSTISRMGTAGSAIPIDRAQRYNGFQPGERDVVGERARPGPPRLCTAPQLCAPHACRPLNSLLRRRDP